MLDKLFNKALTLTIDGEEISFSTLNEFEFALGGRTNVPATKLSDLIMLPPDDLKREAKSIKSVERRFVDILSRSIEQPGEIGKLVREIDIQVFSNDFEWRSIFKALNKEGEEYDELRRVAVVKYMQYLRSRQDVIKQTYKVKMKELSKTDSVDKGDAPRVGESTSPSLEESRDFLKETNIFDSISLEAPPDLSAAAFIRLPKGEAVVFTLKQGEKTDLKLSKHQFLFCNDEQMSLIDNQGERHTVSHSKNIVGRDAVCNIVVGNGLRDVSRMHLIIEPLSEDRFRFTDLSSHGTFLPRTLMPEALQ